MAVVTIGAKAGNYNFDALGLDFEALVEDHKDREEITLGKGSVKFTDEDGNYALFKGTFGEEIVGKNPTKAVEEITSATVGKNNNVTFTISGLDITGADLEDNATFADYLEALSFKIEGNEGANTIRGGFRADQLYGNGGKDKLYGMDGNDKLFGGAGDDLLFGGNNNDELRGDAGNDQLDGGDGNDKLFGGDGNDKLSGGNNNDELKGEAGDDLLDGGAGDDRLDGGAGNDILNGGTGKNVLIGGSGNDTYYLGSNDTIIEAKGKAGGIDTIFSGTSVDLNKFANVENLVLTGTKNGLKALGDAGDNMIVGNSGANILGGGRGNDVLTGGNGVDTFIFNKGDKIDTITDFNAKGNAHDIIDLNGFGKLKFANLDMEKFGKDGVHIDLGNGDHLYLEHVKIKDLDAGDFQF